MNASMAEAARAARDTLQEKRHEFKALANERE